MISFLMRLGLPAALDAAVVGVVGDTYHFTLDDRSEVATTFAYIEFWALRSWQPRNGPVSKGDVNTF